MFEKDQAVLAEVREMNAEIKQESGLRKNSCGLDLLTEKLSDFSTTGMQFSEITADMMAETEDLFTLSACCNRFAPQYMKICKTLTKAVDHLGGAYLTKVALINRELPVNGLETLTADRLNEMVSFNFRKCKAALDEIKVTQKAFDLELYDQMLTFANVMERLRSTQYKALGMHIGAVKFREIAEKTLAFGKQGSTRGFERKESKYPPFRQSPSYSPDYAVLNMAFKEQEEAAKAESENAENSPKSLPAGSDEIQKSGDEKQPVVTDNSGEKTAADNQSEIQPENTDNSGEILQAAADETAVEEADTNEEKETGEEPIELGNLKHITEPSPYLDILRKGALRAAMNESEENPNSGPNFIFTVEEIVELLEDQEFVRTRLEMAEELRQQLKEMVNSS